MAVVVKNPPVNAGDTELQVRSLGREDLLEEGMAVIPVFLPGEPHEQRSLASYSPWGHRESIQLNNFHFHFQDPGC